MAGRWATTGWWNAANALTAVIGYTQWTGDRSYAGVIETTFRAARRWHRGFTNSYYDDNGWWALAWVAAYDLTRDRRYLEAARSIFDRNTAGWDDTCRGGLWWNEDRKYKNAITNELFLTLAARLHQRAPDAGGSYRTWALREWEWLRASGMIGPSGLVNDGLTAACENNGGTTWTYNQGVILGGLAALHEISGDRGYLEQGESIADAALAQLASPPSASPPGILAEPGEADLGCHGGPYAVQGNLRPLPLRFLPAKPPPGLPLVHPRQCPLYLGQRQKCGQSVRAALGRPLRPGRCQPAEFSPGRAERRGRPRREPDLKGRHISIPLTP